MCEICGLTSIQNYKPIKLFTDEEINRHLENIFNRITTTRNLDPFFYKRVAEKFTEGVYQGYGKSLDDVNWDSPEYKMLFDLRENVYMFSAAKQYQETRKIDSLREGIATKEEFMNKARQAFDIYNVVYGSVEFSSSILQAQAAYSWQEYEKNAEFLPNLTYHTVGDGRVRPEHRYLDGITRPVNDKFWDKYYPPNDWNCRCTVIQTDEKKTPLKDFKPGNANVPEVFQFNAGKDRIIFSNKHPYYDVSSKDVDFARDNFGLGLPGHKM